MDNVIRELLVFVLCFAPVAGALLVINWKRRAWRAQSRLPFGELRRRRAGESLRLKLEALDEKINERLAFFVGLPAVLAMGSYYQRPLGMGFVLGAFLASIIIASVFGWLLQEREAR